MQAMVSDMQMVSCLDYIRLEQTGVKDDHFDTAAADSLYADAFRAYGIDVENLEAAEAGMRVCAQPIYLELAAALDDWAFLCKLNGIRTGATTSCKHLLGIARAADPDAWRNRFREALESASSDRKTLEDLAASADIASLPAPTLSLLGRSLWQAGAVQMSATVLRQAQQRFPQEFMINSQLGQCYSRMKRPELGEALRFYTTAVAIRPQSPGAHLNLGLSLADVGRFSDAVTEFRTAILLKSDYGAAHYQLGITLQKLGKSADAVAALREANRLNPGSVNVHLWTSRALDDMGQLDEAIAGFREVIRLGRAAPDTVGLPQEHNADFALPARLIEKLAQAHNGLGSALVRQGKVAEAESEFREAIRIKPDLATAHNELGSALVGQGKVAEAESEFREAIRIKPDLATAHTNLGAILCDRKHDYEAAIAAFHEALRLQPDDPDAHFYLGNALRGQGKLDQAEAEYREVIRLKPNYAGAYKGLGALLCDDKHDYEGAIAAFREAIRLKPDWAEAHSDLGNALGGQGKLSEAEAEYREAIRLKPDFAQAHNAYAWLLATCPQSGLRNPAQAVESAKKATELAPKVGGYWNTLGVAQYRVGAWQAATTALERSMVLQKGGDACDWLFLAMAHWQLGHKEDAHKWYHQALSWMDKNKSPNEELSRFRAEARALFERQGKEASKEPETSPRKR